MLFPFQVDDLVTDLVDGTILVELVQALTGERLFGTVPSPRSKEDAVTNIQVKLLLRTFRGVHFRG